MFALTSVATQFILLAAADPELRAGGAAGGMAGAGMFSCCCLFYVGIFAVGIALTALWIWMLVEVCTKEPASDPNKVMWILIIVLGHGIGAIIYYFVRRPERIRLYGQ